MHLNIMHTELQPKPRQPPKGNTVEAYFSFVWSSSSLPVLYDVLGGPALCWKKARSQQKM